MARGFTDWTDTGIFPLQDTERDVPVGMRMAMVGGRVKTRPDAGADGNASLTEYARQNSLGTLGDIHPWFFWQTKEREKRAMGSWSMAWAAIVTDAAVFRYAGRAGVQPITRDGSAVTSDNRYRVVEPAWPGALPWQPEGMLAMVMPTTSETEPSSVMLNGDRRLVAPGATGPGEAGTTIVDLGPHGVLCMGESSTPGQGGRHARLQGLVRVIGLTAGSGGLLGGSDLNGLALNYGASQQEGILGYGMVFGPAVDGASGSGGSSGGGSGGTGPITGQSGPGRPVTYGGQSNAQGPGGPPPPSNPGGNGFASSGDGTADSDGSDGGHSNEDTSVEDFGSFIASPRRGHAIGLMSGAASGPLVFGCGKHAIGVDKDGHLITAGHISSSAYFYDTGERDGPFMFEGRYPDDVGAHPIPSMVQLSWDEKVTHNFLGGNKTGKWRWWTTVPYVEASDEEGEGGEEGEDPGSSGPSTPTGPGVPGRPATPGPGNPSGPGRPTTPQGPGHPGDPTAPAAPGTPGAPPSGPIRPGSPPPPPRTPFGPGAVWGAPPSGPIRPGSPPPPPKNPWRPPGKPKGPIRPGPGPNAPNTPQYLLDEYHANQRPDANYAVPPGGAVFSGRGTEYRGSDEILEPISDRLQYRKSGPKGVINKVGGSAKGRDTGLYGIFHPFNTGFAAITMRPQLWLKGAPNFERNPLLHARAYKIEERTRPSVITVRAWGAQNDSGDWDYLTPPKQSRARGGMVNGGILVAPAEFEMEDYLGINSDLDTDSPDASTYVTFAPTVAAAFGKPTTNGHPSDGSKVIRQDTASGKLLVAGITDAEDGTVADIAKFSLDGVQGYVELEGTGAVKVPSGTTTKRPGTAVAGMVRLNTTTGNLEYYDGTDWIGSKGVQDRLESALLAQGPGSYSTERPVARYKPRAGTITDAEFNVNKTISANANRYWRFRIYRDTSVVASLDTSSTGITANTLTSMGTLSNEVFDGSHELTITVQTISDGTQPTSLSGNYLSWDIKMNLS